MCSNRSRLHREFLRQEAEERTAARATRTPLAQLKVLKGRGISVPAVTGKEIKALELNEAIKLCCKEVSRLIKMVRGDSSE